MSNDDYNHMYDVFASNKTGLDHIDKHVYVKMFNYKDVQDYYNDVSIDSGVRNIKVPTFGFGAVDDQLCGNQFIPFDDIESKNSNVLLANSLYGAHACHITGNLLPKTWYQIPCMEFLNFMEKKLSE